MNEQIDKLTGALHKMLSGFHQRMQDTLDKHHAATAFCDSSKQDMKSLHLEVYQMETIMEELKARVQQEREFLPKLQGMVDHLVSQRKRLSKMKAALPEGIQCALDVSAEEQAEEAVSSGAPSSPVRKTKKRKGSPPPKLYVTEEELASVSSYFRGRLTLQKINAAIDEMAEFAASNARLLTIPRKSSKVNTELLKKIQVLREIATTEGMRGLHFFLETDMRGQILKMDNTSKAIITLLRHLGRIGEARVKGGVRVITLLQSLSK